MYFHTRIRALAMCEHESATSTASCALDCSALLVLTITLHYVISYFTGPVACLSMNPNALGIMERRYRKNPMPNCRMYVTSSGAGIDWWPSPCVSTAGFLWSGRWCGRLQNAFQDDLNEKAAFKYMNRDI